MRASSAASKAAPWERRRRLDETPRERRRRAGGITVIPEASLRERRCGHEVMTERVHRHQRSHAYRVTRSHRRTCLGVRSAGGLVPRREAVCPAALDVLAQEADQAGEVRAAATDAADHHPAIAISIAAIASWPITVWWRQT